uniref:Short-chain dehydrogenase/reductase SDR n=1 Tax=uncultured bacterium Contigcl_1523 TaxID=1393648 RepID=W0FLW7_9BACT|nr:short-chain dehydrogenase/reductase SDR [uncultured bacterium Contigcl_1523]
MKALNRKELVKFLGSYLVTGACGGMGAAICRSLTGSGHQVLGLDRVLPGQSVPWRSLRADITDESSLSALAESLRAEGCSLNGIVHAAGIYDLNSFAEIPEEDLIRIFNVNLFGMCRMNRLFLPLLEEGSRIVIISSELAPLRPLPFTGVYAVTKGAVEKYAYSLRMELQLLGHRVIVIRPGAVSTGMLPASTARLDRFCHETVLYRCNAERFRDIVNRVEARNVPPERVAAKIRKALSARRPRLLYALNRSPLLLLFSVLPSRAQLRIIRFVISPRDNKAGRKSGRKETLE